jgi:hypothetical protein
VSSRSVTDRLSGALKPGFVIVAAAACGVVGTIWPLPTAFGLALVGIGVAAVVLKQRLHLGLLSPLTVLLPAYVAIAFAGPLASGSVLAGVGVSARLFLPPEAETATTVVFLVAAGSAATGACLQSVLRPRTQGTTVVLPPSRPSRAIRSATAVLSVLPLLAIIAAYQGGLIYRTQYIPLTAGNPVAIAASTLSLPGIAMLGWLTQVAQTKFGKLLAWLILVLYAASLLSRATREFALMPSLTVLGILAANPTRRDRTALVAAAAAVCLVLLQVPLTLRSLPIHGLLPYLAALPHAFGSLDFARSMSNVLFSFQLVGYVAVAAPPLDLSNLLVSLDPRHGTLAGWYDLNTTLRVNGHTPYSAIGELANYGWLELVAYMFLVGLYFAHLDWRIRSLISDGQAVLGLLIFGLACLFVVLTLQYNLRSATRVIYYLLMLDASIFLLARFSFWQHIRLRASQSDQVGPLGRSAA